MFWIYQRIQRESSMVMKQVLASVRKPGRFQDQRDGTLNPLIVYPYVRPPKEVDTKMNPEWCLGLSDSGWMRADIFFEYVANYCVNTWLEKNKVTKTVLLFVDGHKSHLTMELSKFCHSNGIIQYALPANTKYWIKRRCYPPSRASFEESFTVEYLPSS